MASYSLFKTTKKIGENQQVFEELNKKFGGKYKVEFNKASSGAMQFVTGNTTDYIAIKKNAYHGVTLGVSPADASIDYQTITISAYTPNAIVRQIFGRTGILDLLIIKLIWGSGNDFYDEIDNFITTEFEGVGVDMGIVNSARQLLRGKSVLDD